MDIRCMDLWYNTWNTRISSFKLFMECSNKSEEIKSGGASDKGMGTRRGEQKKCELIKAMEHRAGNQWALRENCTIFHQWLVHSKENSITCHAICRYYSCRISMSINWFSSFLKWFRFLIASSREKSFLLFSWTSAWREIVPTFAMLNRFKSKNYNNWSNFFFAFHLYKTTQRTLSGHIQIEWQTSQINRKKWTCSVNLGECACVCIGKGVPRCERYLLVVRLHLKFKLGLGVNFGVKCNQLDCIALFGECEGSGEQMWFFTFGWCK